MNFQTIIRACSARSCSILTPQPASAHHSTAMFEWGKEKTLEGTVDKYEWTQPHGSSGSRCPARQARSKSGDSRA